MINKELSKCCGAEKIASISDEGTGCYLCSKCKKEFITNTPERTWCEDFDDENFLIFDKSSGSRFLDELKLKSFISTLLTQERENLIKIAEGLFRDKNGKVNVKYEQDGEIKSYNYVNQSQNKGYNQGLQDLIAEVRKNK